MKLGERIWGSSSQHVNAGRHNEIRSEIGNKRPTGRHTASKTKVIITES